jgi:hypothetical protein
MGYSPGASAALQDVLERAFRERQLEQEAARQQQYLELQQRQQAESQRRNRIDEARLTVGQLESMGQGTEIDPATVAQIQGTPFASRLQPKTTLPLRPVDGLPGASDPGGRAYTTLAPTIEQMQAQQQQTDLSALGSDPTMPTAMRRLIALQRAGVRATSAAGLGDPEVPEDPAVEEARQRRKALFESGLRRAEARERPRDRPEPAPSEILRVADAAAAAHIQRLIEANEVLTREDVDRIYAEFRATYHGQPSPPPPDADQRRQLEMFDPSRVPRSPLVNPFSR